MNILPDQSVLLTKLMDVSELRHSVISHNLANVNTPGYHRLEVAFGEMFEEVQQSDQPGQVNLLPTVREEEGLQARADGNNVDIDREAVQLEKNALSYQAYLQILTAQVNMMRKAVEG
ncbi:MAG: flagellar basal body rod protein FlgB [Planctomycetaceae bacterium]